jgi:chitodextrinase
MVAPAANPSSTHRARMGTVVHAAAIFLVLAWAATASAKPRDSDHDGLSNHFEVRHSHTNPHRKDTDGDGLNDRYELRRSHTNPRRKDTDRDGLNDRYELRRSHTNPRKRDTDRDGLSDGDEVKRFGTSPLKRDSDGDGIPDGVEVYLAILAGSSDPGSAARPPGAPAPGGGGGPGADTQAPSAPTGLSGIPGDRQVALFWVPSTDNVGVAGYRIYRGGTQVGSASANIRSYNDGGLANGQAYSYTVRAVDAAGNLSPPSNTVSVTPDAGAAAECTSTVSTVAAAESAVDAAAPGAVVCLANGVYTDVSLSASKAAPGVTLRAANPGGATLTSATLSGSYLTLSRFLVNGGVSQGDAVRVLPGSDHITVEYNHITGGYFGVDAGPTSSDDISDTTVRGNQLVGPFGEDAIRINRYHDGPDADPYGILIDGNEISGVRENGNHSDCLQSVWGGDHLYFVNNYEHDNRCQGFFVKDQPDNVDTVVAQDNLFVRNAEPCAATAPGCGQPSVFQLFGPMSNLLVERNTIWTPEGGSPTTLRDSGWGRVDFDHNEIYRAWSDTTDPFGNYGSLDNGACKRELDWPATGIEINCSPGFPGAGYGSGDDFRLGGSRGVDWRPADRHFGP